MIQFRDNAPLLGFKVWDIPCVAYFDVVLSPHASDPACGSSLSEYFWLDYFHPTWPVHLLMADRVKQVSLH